MNRRVFLQLGGVIGATACSGINAFSASSEDKNRHLGSVRPFRWDEVTIGELQHAFQHGEITAVSLTRAYLRRIDQIDRSGPTINSVIELNPDALDISRSLDKERKARGPRGPLHGIPILL